jgi:hypothetical protein
MQKLNSFIIIFISAIAIITSGCKKESETNNTATQSSAIDNAVGSYPGTSIITNNGTGQVQTEARTVIVTKGTNNNLIIDLGAGLIVTTDAVIVSGKDVTGSIPEQNVISFTVKGVGNMGNHFGYSESNGKSGFSCHVNLKQPGFEISVLFVGYK